jgi:hypothetical protein
MIDNKLKKNRKNDITTDIIVNVRSENILKTSKNYQKKVSTICINVEDVTLVERTAKKMRRIPILEV